MKSILRLIRLPNLIIVMLTLFLVRYGIIQSILISYGIDLKFPFTGFILMVGALVLISAGGYMINDYFDVKIDLVNRKEKVVVGAIISEKTVHISYFILNAAALCLAAYACLMAEKFSLFILFPIAIGGLWFYSTTYKKQLFLGTLLVSLFTAAVPVLVLLFELPLLYKSYHQFTEAYNVLLRVMMGWCGFFALFAFLTNFIREIIKDSEDFEGDAVSDRKTLPIVYGIQATKAIVGILILIVILLIEYLFFTYLKTTCTLIFDSISFFYIHLLIIIPLLVGLILVMIAGSKKDYTIASSIIKIVLVAGIFYALVVRYNITKCI